MHICSAILDMGRGQVIKTQGAARQGHGEPAAPWALGLGPGAISIMAEYMWIKTIDRQSLVMINE